MTKFNIEYHLRDSLHGKTCIIHYNSNKKPEKIPWDLMYCPKHKRNQRIYEVHNNV